MVLGRLLGVLLATALLSLTFPLFTAQAHIPPERTSPEAGAVLDQPPTSVDLWFPLELDISKPVELRVVHNLSGRRVDRGGEDPIDPIDPKHMHVALVADLRPGRYVVSWKATSVDGHPAYPTSFSFTMAEPVVATNDERVPMMLAVFGAAVFTVSVGGVGYLMRRQLGLVAPPPEQPPSAHH